MNNPWNDARSYYRDAVNEWAEDYECVEDMTGDDRRVQRVVTALGLAIAVFCIVWFGGRELLAVVS